MASGFSDGLAPRSKHHAGLQRDAALIRVSRTRRALFVGAAALSAGLAAVASAVAPGRSLGAKPTFNSAGSRSTVTATAGVSAASVTRASAAAPPAARMPPLAGPSELGLQAPDGVPQPAPSQSTADSGSGSASQQAAAAASQAPAAPAASARTQQSPAAPAASAPTQQAPPSGGVVSGGS